jgi:hypothetical protein
MMIKGMLPARWDGQSEIPLDFIMAEAQRNVGFGPWISFKIADMLERVKEIPITFNNGVAFMFDEPAKAADLVWEQTVARVANLEPDLTAIADGAKKRLTPTNFHNIVVELLEEEFASYRAPPRGDRPINIQEIETVLCKYKAHINGHYEVGKDIKEIRHGLEPWLAVSDVARVFNDAMPPAVSGLPLV